MNCARKNFGRSDIADNWLVTRYFCFKCVQKCAHADSGKSLSGARRGNRECTPNGYVTSVPSRSISPLTVGRRCICRLQDEHCAAPAFSGFEWETFACFPHVLCTEGLAYLKTAAVRRNLKEPANVNACVFGVVGQRGVGKTEDTTTLFYREDSRECAEYRRGG